MENLRVATANMLADVYVQTFNEENGYHRDKRFSDRKLDEWPSEYDPTFVYHTRRTSQLDITLRMNRLAEALCEFGCPHILGLEECQIEPQPDSQFDVFLNAISNYSTTLEHTILCRDSNDQYAAFGLMMVYDRSVVQLLHQEVLIEGSTLRATFSLLNHPDHLEFDVFCHHNNPVKAGGVKQWNDLCGRIAERDPPRPYLLLGDFNRDVQDGVRSRKGNHIQRGIDRLRLQDPWRGNNVHTYAPPSSGEKKRFDYILLSEEFRVVPDSTWVQSTEDFLLNTRWRARNALICSRGTDHAPIGVSCTL